MNLIELYGSYENAKRTEREMIDQGFVIDVIPLSRHLLEHRREHNIYELGDKIVFIDGFMHDEVMTVSDGNNVALWMDDDTKHAIIEMVRHTTDAEIKAMTRDAD